MIRYNKRMEEELSARQRQERLRLPRIQRTEGRARMTMFKKSLKLQGQGGSNDKEQIKQVCITVGWCHPVPSEGWEHDANAP